jgi:alpha/beta hydrolase family protein
MVAANSLTAAAASIVGHRVQTTSLESTSATTTYQRMTVDSVGVFYREAGPKKAPAIVLLHGFPSSSREFDTLIPLLATRYHLIAPDFPGFGQSDAPPPSSYAYTFDNLARTINRLLEQLKINKYTLSFMTTAGRSAFASSRRIRIGFEHLSSRMPMRIRKAWAPNGPALHNIGPIRKRIPKYSTRSCRLQRPNSVTGSAPHILNVITRTPGLTSTLTCRNPASARYKLIYCTTTGQTSLRTRSGKHGCVNISHRLW